MQTQLATLIATTCLFAGANQAPAQTAAKPMNPALQQLDLKVVDNQNYSITAKGIGDAASMKMLLNIKNEHPSWKIETDSKQPPGQ